MNRPGKARAKLHEGLGVGSEASGRKRVCITTRPKYPKKSNKISIRKMAWGGERGKRMRVGSGSFWEGVARRRGVGTKVVREHRDGEKK